MSISDNKLPILTICWYFSEILCLNGDKICIFAMFLGKCKTKHYSPAMKNEKEERILEFLTDEQISRMKSVSDDFSELSGNCIYSHITTEYTRKHSIQHENSGGPNTVKGFVILLLIKGKLTVEVNTRKLDIEGPILLVIDYGSLVRIQAKDNEDSIDIHCLYYSPNFIRDVNITFSAFSTEALIEHDDPSLHLQEREVPLLVRYFKLISTVIKDNFEQQLSLHTVSSLTSALIYQLMSIAYRRVRLLDDQPTTGSRRNSYVQSFLKLVHVNYPRERSVSYYADQLFISPKYLSLLVKEATGRSAARWIDFFVIMEAKNLLRYSGKNVQQVAYALNFSNQSAFGKYFKHITGLSPSEYQKS